MSNSSDFKDAHRIGTETKIETIDIEGIMHIQVPEGVKIQSMADLMAAPSRIKAHPKFTDIDGFSEYIEEFKEPGSRIFVDDKGLSFTTIFDCHAKNKPAWGDHGASMDVIYSNEWNRFKQADGKSMRPSDFAEFIEDNIQYLTKSDGKTGADILSMAQTFKIKIKGDVEVRETLSQGMKKLIIIDDSVIRGTNEKGKEVEFPEKLSFDLRIFKNHSTYPIEVFLRTRTADKGLYFLIKIPDAEGLEEEAFSKIIEKVAKITSLPTLKGSFRSDSLR